MSDWVFLYGCVGVMPVCVSVFACNCFLFSTYCVKCTKLTGFIAFLQKQCQTVPKVPQDQLYSMYSLHLWFWE